MNADEIVMALREKYDETAVVYFFARTIFREAADLIESLQAQLAEYEATGLAPGDIKDLQGLCKENGLSEYFDLIVEAKWQMGKANERSIEQDERIEQLEAQLAESQRRAQAAVEDLYRIAACDACKHYDPDENACAKPMVENYKCFEWRSPQEAGKMKFAKTFVDVND